MRSMLTVRIRVRGRLSERVASAFDGLTPISRAGATELVGELVDHAQLHGVLARIRDLGLELEAVTVSDVDPANPDRRLPASGGDRSHPSTAPRS